MKTLCTFPGKNGDILWSLPTARQISRRQGIKIDFAIMPQYHTLLPLLQKQSFINKAFVIEDWLCTGSPHGDQPWEPQSLELLRIDYDAIYNLGYRYHPGIHGPQMALIDFVAYLHSIELDHPVLPFIDTEDLDTDNIDTINSTLPIISYSFNMEYKPEKDKFLEILKHKCPHIVFIDVCSMPWEVAASVIKKSDGFVGCCSANHVLAYGVGQKNIFIFEPHPNRHSLGGFGGTFTCPYGKLYTHPFGSSPEVAADVAANDINIWKTEENNYETAKA